MKINHVNITIGKRGTGKTTLQLKRIAKHPLKTLIIDTIDHHAYRQYRAIPPIAIDDKIWKKGTVRVFVSDFKEVFHQLTNNVSNAYIVFEDCTKYIRYNVNDDIRKFIVDSKQKNIDLCFIYHGFGMVQPDMFRLADSLTILKTNENINTYKSKVPNFETVKVVNELIQKSSNPYIYRTVRIN